jgi:hypothetical protein
VSDSPSFSAHFDEEAFAEDLAHATEAGRQAAEAERTRIERDGIPANQLLACDPEARDGTRLGGCVKTYLPQPDGDWGMVFTGDTDEGCPGARLPCVRRPPSDARLAAERLPGRAPPAALIGIRLIAPRLSLTALAFDSRAQDPARPPPIVEPAMVEHVQRIVGKW